MAQPTALITGAGSGIGKSTALRFLHEGWNVILVGRRAEPLKEIEQQNPGRAVALPCDLTSARQVEQMVQRLQETLVSGGERKLVALINNAGAYERASFLESGDALWEKQFAFNVLAPVRLTRMIAPFLVKNGGGSIVNIASTVGLRPVAQTAAYAATKAAMVNWTQTLALELAPQKVRVNCVCPGIVDTPIHPFHAPKSENAEEMRRTVQTFQPLGRIGRPEEIAHSVWHFCAPGSEWMTGSILAVDGGISLV